MPARHGHIEVGLRSKKPAGLSMNEGLRVSMGGCAWARMRNSATTCVAVELLRAEDRLEILAAGTHADEIVLDGDPLENVGLLAGPAAHMPLVIQAVPSSGSADTWSRAASASIIGYAGDHLANQARKASEDHPHIAGSARLGLASCREVTRTQNVRFWRVPGPGGTRRDVRRWPWC